MKQAEHIIKEVKDGSIAQEMGLETGDVIISINGQEIEDVFDYEFLCQDEYLEIAVRASSGEECILEIEKDENEELGIIFENGLMDNYRSCHNKCIFCFIDQNPKGMRESLYFKDDDSRLSFLQGNYITLTNLSDHDLDRMIKYRLEPINISFQTMNPELRCKMLNNRFAGEALNKVKKLYDAGILMNGQIVLCKGVNDKDELRYSLDKLFEYYPILESVSVVPVGLTKFREGLYPLEPFTKEDACEVIDLIEEYQKKAIKKGPYHFVHASDEWYLLAERELPDEETYDDYLQYENGVGMLRSFINETAQAIDLFKKSSVKVPNQRKISIAVGVSEYNTVCDVCKRIEQEFNNTKINVYQIINDFYGHMITVTGLITGTDLMKQLKDKELGNELILSENMVRCGDNVFLDDYSVDDVQNALQVPVRIVKSSGMDFISAVLGISVNDK